MPRASDDAMTGGPGARPGRRGSVSMTGASMPDRLRTLCEQAVADRVFPGCQVGYLHEGRIEVWGSGRLTYDDSAAPVTSETVYDVASITKSIPTNMLALALVDEGKLGLDEPATSYIPEWRGRYAEQASIRHLLTYTVVLDLPGGIKEVARRGGGQGVLDALLSTPLLGPPGKRYYYTNAPAMLLAMIVERVSGKSLDDLAAERFFRPLGMERTTFDAQQYEAEEVAPTELDGQTLVHRVVHDDSARALGELGRRSGGAGLFSTAGDLLRFVRMMLEGGSWEGRQYLSRELVRAVYTNQLETPGGDLSGARTGLGWELDLGRLPENMRGHHVFGKTGFTGCAIVADATTREAIVYLSNRTYPRRPMSREHILRFREDLVGVMWGDQGRLAREA